MTTEPDTLILLADAQFLIAQLLREPRSDLGRAMQLATVASKTHPDPGRRATIASWLAAHYA